ncbi:grsT [Symbiodinium natans]|uniref:GrsT protein n=1 Tax=Symbiodinium natans TaxID=878477 RepID=A0A812M0J3_9DINO|nr:grsT [Symbiodinium natans]
MYRDFRELWTDELCGWDFGRSSISVYESKADLYHWQRWEKPYVVVWLHGMHQGPIDAGTLRKLQRRLWRRVIFLVPTNPEPHNGMHFSWGCTFTKAQNKQVSTVPSIPAMPVHWQRQLQQGHVFRSPIATP